MEFVGYVSTLAYWYEGNYYAMWYISVTVMLYALFPLIYLSIFYGENTMKTRLARFGLVLISILFLFMTIKMTYPEYWNMHKFGLTKSIMFPIGIYVGYLANKDFSLKANHFLYFMLICIVLLFSTILKDYFSVVRSLIGIPIYTILIEAISKKSRLKEWLFPCIKYCGKYSLELYLLHVLFYFSLAELLNIPSSYAMMSGIAFAMFACSYFSRKIRFVQEMLLSKVKTFN